MTNSRSISHAVRLVSVAVLTLGAASFAADPLQPDSATQLRLLEPPILAPSMRVGIFDLHPDITTGVTYDDNFALSPTNKLADWIWTITPHLSAVADNTADGYGSTLTLDYAPSFVIFTSHPGDDSIDQHARLSASWVGNKLSLSLIQQFDQTDGGVAEVGERIRQRHYLTALGTKYKLGERTSVELNPRLDIGDPENHIGYTEYAADFFLNRVITSKITGSVGGSAGYIDVTDGSNQIYQRALGRVAYGLSGKVDLVASAGAEWRQFTGNESDTATPVFGVGMAYRPFESTTITLEGRRRDEVSISDTNATYTATGVTLGIRQRLLERLYATLRGGFDYHDYRGQTPGISGSRRDDIYLLRAGIGTHFGRHWTLDVFYQFSEDDTNDPTAGFIDHQFGLLCNWKL